MELTYATTNISKIEYMRRMLDGLGIDILAPDRDIALPEVPEEGDTPAENAYIKAKAYYEAIGRPLFSCDSGLYIQGLDEKRQPGPRVRRVNGRELSDEEMIEYYSKLVKELGGMARASYRNAICLIIDHEKVITYDGEDLAESFLLVDKPHAIRKPGFPLDSLSVEIGSGEYFVELYEKGMINSNGCDAGFRKFFTNLSHNFR
jgi:8-oxo-dGTP diphosphatase